MVRREILAVFEGKQKGAITLILERLRPPKLVSMHFTSTSTSMNFSSRFYFLTLMDYSPWSEGKFWLFVKAQKRSHNSKTGEATPTKIGFHAFHANLYLPEFFEPILFFDLPWTIVHDASYNYSLLSVLILDKVMLR